MDLVDFARFGKFSEALKTFCPYADGSIDDTCKLARIHVQNTYRIRISFLESVEECS